MGWDNSTEQKCCSGNSLDFISALWFQMEICVMIKINMSSGTGTTSVLMVCYRYPAYTGPGLAFSNFESKLGPRPPSLGPD